MPKAPWVVTKISAKIESKKIVWISTTTVIARDRWGRVMKPKRLTGDAPSISAASSCSLSSDWIAVSRISVAKGSHCQLTIRMMDWVEASVSHTSGSAPNRPHRWASSPLTGSMNMFFQTSADTVGITKNGAITRIRTIP